MTRLETKQFLTPIEVADVLGVSTAAVYQLINHGDLVAVNCCTGGRRRIWRVQQTDLADFVQARRAEVRRNVQRRKRKEHRHA